MRTEGNDLMDMGKISREGNLSNEQKRLNSNGLSHLLHLCLPKKFDVFSFQQGTKRGAHPSAGVRRLRETDNNNLHTVARHVPVFKPPNRHPSEPPSTPLTFTHLHHEK